MDLHTTLNDDNEEKLELRLYVSGMSARSMEAIENIRKLCDEYLNNKVELEIIDIYKYPELAAQQQVVFCPSLIKTYPLPKKILVGTLSNSEKVMNALGISK
ncbi:MAG: circadian clock KaiB family protein [Parafilimonas sp.]|nr:circadian clock KaiB family protein [Parafilimonas sp.]